MHIAVTASSTVEGRNPEHVQPVASAAVQFVKDEGEEVRTDSLSLEHGQGQTTAR